MAGINLTAEQVFAINMALAKGQRIEIIPLKDRIKVVAVKRDELKTKLDRIRAAVDSMTGLPSVSKLAAFLETVKEIIKPKEG